MTTAVRSTPPSQRKPVPAAAPPDFVPVSSVLHFTVDEYHDLIKRGFFARNERFELLDGLIIKKMPRDPAHDACLAQARRLLDRLLPSGWHLRVQSAVTTAESEPEPDLAVVRGTEFDYASRHPGATDVALLVEVANTSLGDDRTWKGPLYARAGFPLYWIINLIDRRVEVFSTPSGPDPAPAYRRRDEYPIGQSVPLSVGGITLPPIAAADLFPPAPTP